MKANIFKIIHHIFILTTLKMSSSLQKDHFKHKIRWHFKRLNVSFKSYKSDKACYLEKKRV